MWRVVLDTNVIVSSLIKKPSNAGRIIELVEASAFELILSRAILQEYLDVLERPYIRALHLLDDERISWLFRRMFANALIVVPNFELQAITADPKDDMFIECAVAGGADVIVSGDNHLLALGSYGQIRIVTPAAFVELMERWQGDSGEVSDVDPGAS